MQGCGLEDQQGPPLIRQNPEHLYETLTGFSHVFNPGGLNNTYSPKTYVLEMALAVGTVEGGGAHIGRTGRR